MYNDTEKGLIMAENQRLNGDAASPDYARVCSSLRAKNPELFGQTEGGLTRQAVRSIVVRASKKAITDERGRPPVLPAVLVTVIMAAWCATITSRATVVSATLLQMVGLGVMQAQGYGTLLAEGRRGKGIFCFSTNIVRAMMKERGWRSSKPAGKARKLPADWEAIRAEFVDSLAYLVLLHEICKELVINADETGVMLTQIKGKSWFTKEQVEEKDKSIQHLGDKRQFTLLASTSAAGLVLPHQVVVDGKTSASFPFVWGLEHKKMYKQSIEHIWQVASKNLKGKERVTRCFVLRVLVTAVQGLGSICRYPQPLDRSIHDACICEGHRGPVLPPANPALAPEEQGLQAHWRAEMHPVAGRLVRPQGSGLPRLG